MKTKKRSKIWKIVGFVLLGIVALLVAIPFFLEAKIADIIKNKVNQNVNAVLDFEEAKLSLIKSFPDAYVDLKNTSLINKAPFEGDTLFYAGDVALTMSLKELFKGADEPIAIQRLELDKVKLHIKVDKGENANYDIALPTSEQESTTNEAGSTNFTLDLESYQITDSQIIYDDFATGMHLVISEMNHYGSGDLSLENSTLETKTDALVSFEMDSTKYLDKNKISLDALLGVDLAQNKYSFLENKALINQLPLVFDGFVQLVDEGQQVDINFKTPSSDFKNFLALVPEAYSKNIEDVTTTGNFEVQGELKGLVDETHIPTFQIGINSSNASFKYPDLPKTVKNVFIDTEINNTTGITEDTYVDIKRLSFQIDEDRFNLNAKIASLLGNPNVNAHADGTINLGKLSKAYPVPQDIDLSGILTADLTTAFDMASVEQKRYERTKTSGTMGLSDFKYVSDELNNPVAISEAEVSFNPGTVRLNSFKGQTGQTDFQASGTINNLLGFMFNEENIEGRFQLNSDTFALNDFMVEETEDGAEPNEDAPVTERIKIPSFLDCTIDAAANSVLYDNLNLKNLKGQLVIANETATLKNLTSELFDGRLNLNGEVSTKEEVSTFDMELGMDSFKIAESFKALDLFKVLAPVASALQGKLNSSIKLSGNLKEDMTPNLATLTGNLIGELLATKVETKNTPMLNALDNKLSFIDLDKLDLKDLKTAISFADGKVQVKPFNLKYKDISMEISGSHSFDRQLEYQTVMDVPAKYLGSDVNKLIAKIDDAGLENVTIPVTAKIGGAYTSPSVTTDLTSGVTQLTKKLVDIQKQKLLNQGKDKAKDVLDGLLNKGGKDSLDTDSTKTRASDVLDGLLGTKKKDSAKTDSTRSNDGVKDAAKSILGGLLGKKKKKDTVQ